MRKAQRQREVAVQFSRKPLDLEQREDAQMHRNGHLNRSSNIWIGLAAGLIGGAVGSWTMERFQAGWNKVSERLSQKQEQASQAGEEQQQGSGEEQEPATVRVASVLSQRLFHHELSERGKKVAGPAVHYGFGATMGGLYGALAAAMPQTSRAAGLPFATALWLGADEAALPALRLSEPPTRYPVSMHAYALASHLVYGLTTELVRRAILRGWERLQA